MKNAARALLAASTFFVMERFAVAQASSSQPTSAPASDILDGIDLDGAFGGSGDSFFQVLEEEQSVVVASRKKESVALAASIIGVIERERIDREGAKTLSELLKGVVGFDTRQGEYNRPQVTLRGYDTAANFLVLVDGHRLNSPYDGSVPFDYPLANVRRIEIIRGPGSAIYGTNAFVGVINLITFDDRDEVGARLWGWSNSTQTRGQHPLSQPLIGAALRAGYDFGKWQLRANGSFIEDKGDSLNIPSDNASLRNQAWSLARCVDSNGAAVLDEFEQPILRLPACEAAGGIWNGRTLNNIRRGEGALDLTIGGFHATGRLIFDERGPGITSTDTQDLYLAYQSLRRELGLYVQTSYAHQFQERHSLQLRASYDQRNSFERFGQLPQGTLQGETVLVEGQTTETSRIGRTFYFDATSNHEFILSPGFAGQANFDFGAAYLRRQVDNSRFRTNYGDSFEPLDGFVDASTRLGPLNRPGTDTPFAQCTGGRICTDGRSDNQLSTWAQGRWLPNMPVTGLSAALTAGVRLDYELGFGPIATPRAGLTFATDEKALPVKSAAARAFIPKSVKLLYGSAFRLPTIRERYDNVSQTFFGSPTLVAERINSFEVGIGWKWLQALELNANFFYSAIENSIQEIYNAGREPIRQQGSRNVQGVELEARAAISVLADAYINATIFDGSENGFDPTNGLPVVSRMEDQAKVRLNFGVEFQIWRFLYAGVYGQFTDKRSNRTRSAGERGHLFSIPPYFLLHASIRLKEPVKGLTAQIYGRNLTNTSYKDPLSPAHDADVKLSAGDQSSYLLPRAGITFGLELVYVFGLPGSPKEKRK